eukprot:359692-Chlamydomonas_euryale.AAC.6
MPSSSVRRFFVANPLKRQSAGPRCIVSAALCMQRHSRLAWRRSLKRVTPATHPAAVIETTASHPSHHASISTSHCIYATPMSSGRGSAGRGAQARG